MASTAHLVRRFLGSLRPGGPARADASWVDEQLLPAERELWRRPVLAAALLHDVGKVESGLRTYGRVVATLSARFAGPEMANAWRKHRGFTRRVGLYLHHAEVGGDLLELTGSDPLTVAWARQHHLPESAWTVPAELGAVLKAADDD
jgi:hypothetical protein